MNENFIQIMQQTLNKLDEISNKLEHIETNTHQLDDQQARMQTTMQQLRAVVQNDNIIG